MITVPPQLGSPPARFLAGLLLACLALAGGTGGVAAEARPAGGVEAGSVAIEAAWARPGFPGGTSAVYMVVTNRGEEPLRLVGAQTVVAQETHLHRTVLEERAGAGGETHQVMRMEDAGLLELAPGERLLFEPGGLHVMLVHLTQALSGGDRFELTLLFDGLDPITLAVPVLSPGEAPPAPGSGL